MVLGARQGRALSLRIPEQGRVPGDYPDRARACDQPRRRRGVDSDQLVTRPPLSPGRQVGTWGRQSDGMDCAVMLPRDAKRGRSCGCSTTAGSCTSTDRGGGQCSSPELGRGAPRRASAAAHSRSGPSARQRPHGATMRRLGTRSCVRAGARRSRWRAPSGRSHDQGRSGGAGGSPVDVPLPMRLCGVRR
jgi:hypothetical protein